jgi:parvulin-like peptidyl-prolyl isomerase
VITLNGFCEAPATAPAKPTAPQNCRKVITKAEFEKVMEAVIPKSRRPDADANPQVKQAIARQYADILVMANEAKKRGIQHNPNTQELLRLSQLQVLAQGLLQDLNEKAKPSETEITKYYNDNKASFEEGIVRRLFIPKQTAPAPAQPAAGSEAKPAPPATNAPVPDAAAQKAFAEKIRERGAAGEDFDKLQKEAFESAKNTQTPPSTQLGPRRRGSLPPDHDAAVFALKPGEVSQLFDTASGWYLYKLESKRQVPLSDVREELTRRLQPQKFTDARTAIANSVKPDFNPDYFGATTTSPVTAASPRGAAQTPKGPRLPRGAAPPAPAQPAPQPQPTQPK